jgi:hypothetical protein
MRCDMKPVIVEWVLPIIVGIALGILIINAWPK